MSGKFHKPAMTLKQFMVHQEVLKLYRNIMRTIRNVPNEADRKFLKDWARTDFRTNMHVTDEIAIKSLIIHGENSLMELRKNLNLTKCS